MRFIDTGEFGVYQKLLIMAGLLLLPISTFADENNKSYSIIQDEREKKLVFEQCSRMTPSFRTSFRELDVETVEKVEALLSDAVSTASNGKVTNIDGYFRQYVGFEILRRKFIYVNAFSKADVTARAKGKRAYGEQFDDWDSKAVNACGGEMNYWGVIFDNSTGTVAEVLFNSRAKTK